MARILVLDLNPQLSYPDLSIAYLVTPLRSVGHHVEVKAVSVQQQTNQSTNQALKHNASQALLNLTNIQNYLENTKPDLILVPTYLKHYAAIQTLAAYAQQLQLPLILGGACLNTCSSEDLPLWLNLEGVSAVFVGEADWVITELVDTVISKQDLSIWPGIHQQQVEAASLSAPPLQELERLPIPDLSDFAWQQHPSALIPILAGRAASLENRQRIHTTRPVQAVLDELSIQAERYQRKAFIFLDARLNTNLAMWHGLIDNIQHAVPGCSWMATIYLDGKNELGLDLNTLVAARAAGLKHLNISLEASQILKHGKLLTAAMERNRALVDHAYQAGLSVRCLVNNNESLNNLADLPNTNELLLRKLIETEQAKQASLPQLTPKAAEVKRKLQAAKTKQNLAKAIDIDKKSSKSSTTDKQAKRFWQRLLPQALINKTNKTTEANQLV